MPTMGTDLVADRVGVSKTTIISWGDLVADEMTAATNPTQKGTPRQYSPRDVLILMRIKANRDEGVSLDDIPTVIRAEIESGRIPSVLANYPGETSITLATEAENISGSPTQSEIQLYGEVQRLKGELGRVEQSLAEEKAARNAERDRLQKKITELEVQLAVLKAKNTE